MAKSKIIGFYHPHPRHQYTGELVDPATGVLFTPPSMTKQEFKRECDINNIIKEFQTTGMLNHVNTLAKQGAYLDLPDDVDYQTSLNIVAQAQTSFMSLPAKIRDRFDNDPAAFLNFMADPNKLDEAVELGLIIKTRTEPAEPAPSPTPPPAPTGTSGGS